MIRALGSTQRPLYRWRPSCPILVSVMILYEAGQRRTAGVSQSIKVFVAISVSLVGLGLAWIFGIPALEDVLRTRRRSSRYGGRAEVEYAWEDLTDALTSVGLEPEKSETRKQYVSRVAPKTRLDTSALSTVATLTDEASYGASGDRRRDLRTRAALGNRTRVRTCRTCQPERTADSSTSPRRCNSRVQTPLEADEQASVSEPA